VRRLSRQCLRDFVWLLLVLAVAGLLSYGPLCVKAADEASSSVAEADVAVREAFQATLNAERAGANDSGLMLRLNEAGVVLGEAEIAFVKGDSSGAVDNASLCISIAESVKSDADVLKASALDEAQAVFRTSLIVSVVGIAAFVVVLVLVWRRFKRGYVRKTLGLKPEVAYDEA
jgi:hypothetical protein